MPLSPREVDRYVTLSRVGRQSDVIRRRFSMSDSYARAGARIPNLGLNLKPDDYRCISCICLINGVQNHQH